MDPATKQTIQLESKDDTLRSLIENFQKKSRQTLEEVNWTIIDQEKILDDWDIYFAVDFYHIYEYAYPKELLASEQSNNSEILSDIVQHRFALQFLFFSIKFGTPILLPPHLGELRNHLKNPDNTFVQYDMLLDQIQKKIFTDEELLLIEKANIKYNEENLSSLPDDIYNPLTTLIFKKLPKVLFLLSGFSENGLNVIKDIIQNDRIILQPPINDYNEIIENVIDSNETEIYNCISDLRRGRYSQNFNDSQAIKIVAALNEAFIKRGEKKIIYLLSDAQTIEQLFHPEWYGEYNDIPKASIQKIQNSVSVFGSQNSVHRTTNIFLEYMLAAKKHLDNKTEEYRIAKKETLEWLKKRRDFFVNYNTFDKSLTEILKKCTDSCDDNCPQHEVCIKIKGEIHKWNELFNRRISMALLEHFDLIQENISNKNHIEAALKELVYFLLNKNNEQFEKTLSDKRSNLEKIYFQTIEDLSNHIFGLSFDVHTELVHQIKPMRRIPFNIHFTNDNIKLIFEEAEKYLSLNNENIDEEKLNEVKTIAERIFKTTKDNKIEAVERNLLLAIINYNFNQLDNACLALSDYISKKDYAHEYYKDCSLVYLLSLHQDAVNKKNTNLYKEALDECEELIRIFPNDSRFVYMQGVILGRGIESRLENKKGIEDIIEVFQKAYDLIGNEDEFILFKATILNSIAYAICLNELSKKENANSVDNQLSIADKAFAEMKSLIPIDRWEANFNDTIGLFYYLQSKVATGEAKESYAQASNEYLAIALKKARDHKYLPYEIKNIEEHFNLVKNRASPKPSIQNYPA